jgi:hypothetical protein
MAPDNATRASTGIGATADGSTTQSADLAGTAKDAADQMMSFARSQASARLAPQIDNVCQSVGSTASAIRSMSSQLREQNMGDFAGYADQAAAQLEGVTSFLEGKDLDDLVVEAERFARNQPAVFIGGALLLGFMASRFLKASTPQPGMADYERYRSRMNRADSYRPAYYNPQRPLYNASTQPAHYGSTPGAYAGTSADSFGGGSTATPGAMAARGSATMSPSTGTMSPATGTGTSGMTGSPASGNPIRPASSSSPITPGTNQGTGSS